MSHYFTNDPFPMTTREVTATVLGRELVFTTADGAFSDSRLGLSTSMPLRTVTPPEHERVLNPRYGFGSIMMGIAAASPGVRMDAVDVSERAPALIRVSTGHARMADRVRTSSPDDAVYDEV